MHWNSAMIQAHSDEIREFYACSRYVLLRQFALPELSFDRMSSALEALPIRKVQCWEPGVTWSERQIPCDGEIASGFKCLELVELIGKLLARPNARIRQSLLWASIYGEGEYIHAHVDNDGDFQIIFCHEATSILNGGTLFLKPRGETVQLQLDRNDAILFCAKEVEHWTSPVRPTAEIPSPRRTTVACRYWLC